ncbi:MAG: hypothetical protein L0206_17365 [Actinobacteria bacterium]|nr:hypothetical protein [Actinomycetota bacterium]
MRKRRAWRIGALSLATLLVVPGGVAEAQTTYEVLVGQFLEGPAPAKSMRYFPGDIDVHQGDTLHFTSNGFHTATLLPSGLGPVEFFDVQAALGTSQPFAFVQPDPDDGPDSFKFGNTAIFPTDPTCGGAGLPACSFDGSSVLNSGAPFFGDFDFSVTVDAAAGSTFYGVCIIHGPNMRMRIDVVSAGEPASDPADIDAANAAALTQDLDTSAALHERFSTKQRSHVTPDGRRVWDAWAGVESRHVALFAMYPSKLNIDQGDTVQWHFDSLNYEDHTVTLPIDTAREIVRNAPIVCDPDGDAGPGPDNPPDIEQPPFCNDPSQFELELDDRFVPAQGNGIFSGPDLESSGVLGANSTEGDANYELTFKRGSPTSGFKYICLIHPFMRGRVVVKLV